MKLYFSTLSLLILLAPLGSVFGASGSNQKPNDGVNVWATIAEGKPSPRTEIIYNIEPFRGAVRQGDWKLIWRTLISTSVDLYNITEDPYEKNNVAAAHPDKVAEMQKRIEAAGKESAKSLALGWILQTAMKNAVPLLPTDEAFYTDDDDDSTPPKIGSGH